MTKEEKIKRLKLIFLKRKTIATPINNLSNKINLQLDFDIIPTPTNSDNEIIFDNIEDVISIVKKVRRLNKTSQIDFKNYLLGKCDECGVDCNSIITIRFSTS